MKNSDSRVRILVACSDQALKNRVVEAFSKSSSIWNESPSGLEALSMILHFPFDLAIIEAGLPCMDALELLLNAKEAHPALGVIVLGVGDPALREHLLLAGADACLSPYFHEEDLLSAMQTALGRPLGMSPRLSEHAPSEA